MAWKIVLEKKERDHPSTSDVLAFLDPLETNFRGCLPKKKIIFAKTHKTGSSTVQNILMRFGKHHNLRFILPEKRVWWFPLEPFKKEFVLDHSSDINFDIMSLHHIWNHEEIRKLIPDGVTFTILRDPVDLFESAYVYYNITAFLGLNIREFAAKIAKDGLQNLPRNLGTVCKNIMLRDLGMKEFYIDNLADVRKKVQQLDKEFDLVMITEMMDESLVLLQDLLCWNIEDMIYLPQNVRKDNFKSTLDKETRDILKLWLSNDYLLYNHFLSKFEKLVKSYGVEKMHEKVAILRTMSQKLHVECIKDRLDRDALTDNLKTFSRIVNGYSVDARKAWCIEYALPEPSFFFEIYDNQYNLSKHETP